jgi:hypothetical protein
MLTRREFLAASTAYGSRLVAAWLDRA